MSETDPSTCAQCGSIRTREVRPAGLERLLALLLRQRVISCGRCGWRGRIKGSADTGGKKSHTRRRRRSARVEEFAAPSDAPELNLAELDRALERNRPDALEKDEPQNRV